MFFILISKSSLASNEKTAELSKPALTTLIDTTINVILISDFYR